MSARQPVDSQNAVRERYLTDPIFHALVHLLSDGGYADDDGVRHDGPTFADAMRVQRFYDALDSINYEIRPSGVSSRSET